MLLGQVVEERNPLEILQRMLEALPVLATQVVDDSGRLAEEPAAVVDGVVEGDEEDAPQDAAHREPRELPAREGGADEVDGEGGEERPAAEGHEDPDRAVVGPPDEGGEGSEGERAGADDPHPEGENEQRIRHLAGPGSRTRWRLGLALGHGRPAGERVRASPFGRAPTGPVPWRRHCRSATACAAATIASPSKPTGRPARSRTRPSTITVSTS